MSTLKKLLPWNWNVDWKSWLPWKWGGGLPVKHVGEYTVDVPLGDVSPAEVEVLVEGRDLVIRGSHRQESEEERDGYRVRRASLGSFERRVRLPVDVDVEEVSALAEEGMITVRCPRRALPEEPHRTVPVRAA